MSTYAELLARKAAYLVAESKALESQEYSVGQGGTARRSRRAELDSVRDEIRQLDAQLARHPDNPAGARPAIRFGRLTPR